MQLLHKSNSTDRCHRRNRRQILVLPQKVLANRWGLSVRTVEGWRRRNTGPEFVRIGRNVRYRLSVVEDYEKSHRSKGSTNLEIDRRP